MVFDLQSDPINVGFIDAVSPGSFLLRRDEGYDEQLFIGDADSSLIILVGGDNDKTETADWRSGWHGGDGGRNIVTEATVTFSCDAAESLMVDFYTDYSETAVWTKTIVATADGSKSVPFGVSRSAQGKSLAYGFRTSDDAVIVTAFNWNVESLGGERKE